MTAQKTYSTSPDNGMTASKRDNTPQARSGMSKSMHDGVEVWCDCCSCEAEPYWLEAMQQDEQARKHK
ncbi:MAG: hypothetical protein PVG45_06175 [Gammaproteobacteria bacterium]|jgi:hypothetical protein